MLQVSEIISTLVTWKDFPLADSLPDVPDDDVFDIPDIPPIHIPWTVTSWPT
jgi:hypothetical protein